MSTSLISVIEGLEAAGVCFRLDGEKIKARLPKPAPPELLQTLETLRARRVEVSTLLRERQAFTVCAHCRVAGCALAPFAAFAGPLIPHRARCAGSRSTGLG